MNEALKINPDEIPTEVYEAGCRILSQSIRRFFENPDNRSGYEAWMKTPEGQVSELTREERAKAAKSAHTKGAIT